MCQQAIQFFADPEAAAQEMAGCCAGRTGCRQRLPADSLRADLRRAGWRPRSAPRPRRRRDHAVAVCHGDDGTIPALFAQAGFDVTCE